MGQIKYTFDKVTLKKIGIGFMYGILTAITTGATAYTSGASTKAIVGIVLASFTGSIANIVKEYANGETK